MAQSGGAAPAVASSAASSSTGALPVKSEPKEDPQVDSAGTETKENVKENGNVGLLGQQKNAAGNAAVPPSSSLPLVKEKTEHTGQPPPSSSSVRTVSIDGQDANAKLKRLFDYWDSKYSVEGDPWQGVDALVVLIGKASEEEGRSEQMQYVGTSMTLRGSPGVLSSLHSSSSERGVSVLSGRGERMLQPSFLLQLPV